MLGNDIDNGVPPRVLVHISAVFTRRPRLKKVLLFTVPAIDYTVDMGPLSYFNRWRDKGLVLELFHYRDDDWPGEDLHKQLDEFHHPFNTLLEFEDAENLSTYLAYSPDVQHVADPLHPLRFGSKSLDSL